jgi:hypothetical protein
MQTPTASMNGRRGKAFARQLQELPINFAAANRVLPIINMSSLIDKSGLQSSFPDTCLLIEFEKICVLLLQISNPILRIIPPRTS